MNWSFKSSLNLHFEMHEYGKFKNVSKVVNGKPTLLTIAKSD
jgi:hypothetical protein